MNSDDVHSSSGRRGRGFVTGGIALALVVLFSYGFVTVFAPMPYEVPVSPFGAYDSAPMQAALATGKWSVPISPLQRTLKGWRNTACWFS